MKKIMFHLGAVAVFAFLLSSCLDLDVPENIPSKAVENARLNAYLDSLVKYDHDIDTTNLGIYYVTLEEGQGDYPENGDTLVVGYAGYLVNGFLFDSSEINQADGKMEFVLGDPPMIPGWDNGVKYVREGGKIQFIVPSELAYGATGYGNLIGPYESLIFVVKLFELKQAE